MRITETEYVALIREAVDGAVIMARFGPGWVALDKIPENEWAIQRIEDMRSEHVTASTHSSAPAAK